MHTKGSIEYERLHGSWILAVSLYYKHLSAQWQTIQADYFKTVKISPCRDGALFRRPNPWPQRVVFL